MSIFRDKLAAAGWLENMRKTLPVQADNWFANGGTLEEWISVGREAAAKAKPGEGHQIRVSDDHMRAADARSPMPEGQKGHVQQDHMTTADGLPIASGEASGRMPETAQAKLPPARDTLSPIRDEGHESHVSDDQALIADVPNPIPGEGLSSLADKAIGLVPSAGKPIASGEATFSLPEKAMAPVPTARVTSRRVGDGLTISRSGGFASVDRSVIHQRRPSPEQLAARRAAGHTSVPTIFDTKRLPDNRRYVDLRTDEYVPLAGIHIGHASLLLRLNALALARGKLGPRFTTKDVLSANEFKNECALAETIDLRGKTKSGILIEPKGQVSFITGEA